ncbi:TonB-dependent receptor [candidate division KSB1 bacterium]|nr:TonB-dependent receptor [candidate division KSB1 bacterium]
MKPVIQLFLYFSILGHSQSIAAVNGKISGRITDAKTDEPLQSVNVIVDGTRMGAASDENGNYSISRVPSGSYRLIFQILGYKNRIERQVVVLPNKTTTVNATLESRPLELGVVTVTGEREKKMEEQYRPSIKTIRARQVSSTAGGGEDLFRTLQALPGVVARSDLSSQFYVRGGTPDQNLIIVDNVTVFNPYRLKIFGGPISMFNPDAIEYVELLPGGFPAEYGDKLSAVLVVENKEGDRFKHHAKGSISLIDMKTFLEGPVPKSGGDGSWFFSTRRTWYDMLLNQMSDLPKGTMLPFFRDYQGKLVYDLSPSQKLKINFLDSNEGTELKELEVEDGDEMGFFDKEDNFNLKFGINNRLFSVSWLNAISDVTLSNLTLSHFNDSWYFKLHSRDLYYEPNIDMRKLEIRHDVTHILSPTHTLQGGILVADYISDITIKMKLDSTEYYRDNPTDRRDEDGAKIKRDFRFQNATSTLGLYFQDEWKILPPLVGILPGFRMDYSTFSQQWVYSPRFSMTIKVLPNMVLRGGTGYYYQFPHFVSLFERFEREIEWNIFETITLKPEKSIHYLAGIETDMGKAWNLKLEVYRKQLNHLIMEPDSINNRIPQNDGTGYAQGFEAFLQRKASEKSVISGWTSYSYSVTREKTADIDMYERDFDVTHSINLVLRVQPFRNLFIDTQYKYASGFPWTPVLYDAWGNPQLQSNGEVVFGEKNSERYPYYSRLDVRLSWEKQLSQHIRMSLYFELINAQNRKNVLQYYWTEDYRKKMVSYMLPRLPFFGIRFEI